MNRIIIKFRGQDENNNWHFGGYDQENKEIIYNVIDNEGFHKCKVAVNPATVGQFTGFKDIDGNEIFEGDFIKDTKSGRIRKVEWAIDCWLCADIFSNARFLTELVKGTPFRIVDNRIIGNIHDNPELLKKEGI